MATESEYPERSVSTMPEKASSGSGGVGGWLGEGVVGMLRSWDGGIMGWGGGLVGWWAGGLVERWVGRLAECWDDESVGVAKC